MFPVTEVPITKCILYKFILYTHFILYRPDFRPFLRNLMDAATTTPRSTTTSTPSPTHRDGFKMTSSIDEFILKLLNYYVTVELLILKKLSNEIATSNSTNQTFSTCDPNLVKLILPPVMSTVDKQSVGKAKNRKMQTCKLVDAGFSHVLIARPKSGALFSFGSTHFGVLAHNGPLMTSAAAMTQQHSAPKQVLFVFQLKSHSTASYSYFPPFGKCSI